MTTAAQPETPPHGTAPAGSSLIERVVGNRLLMQLTAAVTGLAILIYGTATFPLQTHVVLSLIAIAIAVVVTRLIPSLRLISVVLSLAISFRYIIWRGLETLNLNDGVANAVVSLLLYGAEIYTVLVLIGGYFQTTIFLERKPVPLPKRLDQLPTVDVYIPTYNEGVDIVRRTAVAAMAMDYPKKKVYILDDGRRPHMKALADEVGCGYLIRPDNKHAKSGNINHAMSQTDGELLAFFDADHAPVRSFLQLTVGFFIDNPNLALAQTPHHFYNPDPFERNLYTFGRVPPEQNLFYHQVQVSNDFWNSAFFCGSCAVIRRTAITEVGGMAVETVTEDAHTALKMQSRGWDTAYLNIPQAAGLATESFSVYVGQRIRWARGMAQILRIEAPLTKAGLSWAQRANYTFAALHFFFGLPRLIFLLAPVTYLVFGLNPLAEDVRVVLLYAVPHLALSYINASAANTNQRHSFWPEVYEIAMAPFAALVTTLALFAPKKGKFNVTQKGAMLDRAFFDWRINRMMLGVLAICLSAIPFFVWRYGQFPMQRPTLWVTLIWNLFNCLLILAALAAAIERPQRRTTHRIKTSVPIVALEAQELIAPRHGDDPTEERLERSYASVEQVDPVEVYEDLRDELARRMETSEASLASELRQRPSVAAPDLPVDASAWRAAGRTLDLSEEGVRFRLPANAKVPRHLLLTLIGNDGSRVSAHAEALGAFQKDDALVVRAKFHHLTDEQVHALIRLMFSDPNAWARDRFLADRPGEAMISVATAPFRALFYAIGVLRPPAEPDDAPETAVAVNHPVLQCFHCHGVLIVPQDSCPHCGAALPPAPPAEIVGLPVAQRPTAATVLVPALLVGAAIVLTLGWSGFAEAPDGSLSRQDALELSYHYSATDAATLARALEDAITAGGRVPGDWGSNMSSLRFEFPRATDPRPQVHSGPVPDRLSELLWDLHALESSHRRGIAGPEAAGRVREIRAELLKLR